MLPETPYQIAVTILVCLRIYDAIDAIIAANVKRYVTLMRQADCPTDSKIGARDCDDPILRPKSSRQTRNDFLNPRFVPGVDTVGPRILGAKSPSFSANEPPKLNEFNKVSNWGSKISGSDSAFTSTDCKSDSEPSEKYIPDESPFPPPSPTGVHAASVNDLPIGPDDPEDEDKLYTLEEHNKLVAEEAMHYLITGTSDAINQAKQNNKKEYVDIIADYIPSVDKFLSDTACQRPTPLSGDLIQFQETTKTRSVPVPYTPHKSD